MRRARRTLIALVGSLSMIVGVIAALVAGPTSAPAVPAAVSTTLTAAGFPTWYSDENGVRLEACLDPFDVHCGVLPVPGVFDPELPTVFPTNYPDEGFYMLAESDPIPTPGCAGTRPGDVFIVLALEQAFTNELPAPGDQMVFGRVRVRARGLCPNTPYTFTHPYGRVTITTNNAGAIPSGLGTSDIGCPDTATTCDFAAALASPVLKSFLRWDPAVAPFVDPGYLGNPAIPHRIVGAPFNPGNGPANYFQVQGAGTTLRTNLFSVVGKLVAGVEASPSPLASGDQTIGTTSAPRSVTLTNRGATAATVTGASISPATAGFAVAADNCAAGLAPAATCTIDVTFAPASVGAKAAVLTIATSTGPVLVDLTGTGVAPVLAATPPSVAFAAQAQGVASAPQTVTVRNTGTAALSVTGAVVTGANPTDFVVTNNCLAVVPPAGTCTVSVVFRPGAAAANARAATLTISSNGGASVVALAGQVTPPGGGGGAVNPGGTCPATINGWKGEYWSNITLVGAPLLCRDDAAIAFNWGAGSPAANISVSTFSARWTRTVNFTAGTYTFSAGADDGVRLYVDGQRVIDSWVNSTYRVRTADVALTAGNHTIVMEFYENGGSARADLGWIAKAVPAGLQASWFPNLAFTGTPSLQVVQPPSFSFGAGVAPVSGFPTSNWSVRFTGSLVPTATGNTVIRATNSRTDQVRVYVNNVLVIDNWGRPSTPTRDATVALTASAATSIRIEFADPTDVANLALSWRLPGTTTFVAIPTTQFRPL